MDPKIFECFASSERATKAISRIQAKKYETESWNILIKEAVGRNIDDVEPFYEELISIFPYCGRFWKTYIEHEMRFRRYDKVSKLFQRSLEEVLSVDLYKCYLNFVREAKANEPDLIYKAFRFTLDRVGIDPGAISIYNDYIQFLKERDVDGSYLDSQKITAVRKAYQEGIINPMFHIDTLWKEYISFEQGVDQRIAEKMVQDRSRDHMNARRVAKEWEVTIRGLDRSSPAVPATYSQEEHRQIDIWRRYIAWEKSNPLRTENNLIIMKRVAYAYKQQLLSFGHHPNVWHEYASYLDEQVRVLNDKDIELTKKLLKEEASVFERAVRGLMKNNLLIHFAYADFEETRNDKRKALEIYNNLIGTNSQNNETNNQDQTPSLDLTLVYIQLMRFTRRTEGLKPARLVFKRARDDKRCTHHIYTATALMEHTCTKEQAVACKIFELGLKKFSSCSDYILSYINFMNSLNEENNTRVLFERVLTTCPLPPKDTIEIWNSFLEFEAGIGDLSSISKVERRRKVALQKVVPESVQTSWPLDKYKFQDLTPCTQMKSELDHFASMQNSSNSGNNNTNILNHHDLLNSNSVDNSNSSIVLPDLNQMLPFKPVMNQPIPGGVFAPPPAIGNLMSRLPQQGFWGPYVDIEQLCDIVRSTDFDKLFNNLYTRRTKKAKLE